MTSLPTPVLIALPIAVLVAPLAVLVWWRLRRAQKRNARVLIGIDELLQSFRDGEIQARLPAGGEVEAAVNRLLDEMVAHFRGPRAEAEGRARALDALAGVGLRTVEELDAAVVQVQDLGIDLERRALTATENGAAADAVAALRAGDDRFAGQCETVITLAEQSRSAVSACQRAVGQLRASLTDLAGEADGIARAARTSGARWATLRTGLDEVVRVADTTRILAVNAALAVGREHDARDEFARVAAEADELAHGVTRRLAQVTEAVVTCEQGMVALLGAGDPGRRLDGATDPDLDEALAWIQALPSHLSELATALSAISESRAQATARLAARLDASQLADELQTWTGLAQRVGSELARATGALTAARREARRLLEAAP